MVDGLVGRVSKLEFVLVAVKQDDLLAKAEFLDLVGPQAEAEIRPALT